MENELKLGLRAALLNEASANFSAEDVNTAAINGLLKEAGLSENPTAREIRANEATIFGLIEETIDEILPAKLQNIVGEFAEVRSFPRDAEVVFDIEKLGKGRAKLTISKGARGGIYRAARLDNRYFSPVTSVYTVSVYVTLEELILGTMSLSELFNNVLEGLEEIVYKETFNALATGAAVKGYERLGSGSAISTNKDALGTALDVIIPMVKQYGVPTIFGSFDALNGIYNPVANTTGHINEADSMDIRNYGFVQVYKGTRIVELPNYFIEGSEKWAYDKKYVFVIPSGAKPVKVALKGDIHIERNHQPVGSEKWEAHKIMGVGVAMANNYAVITVKDVK